MSTILVEARKDQRSAPALDLVAATCRSLGHDVFRWRGPFSGRVYYWPFLFPCDAAILFNGTHDRYSQVIASLRESRTPILYMELGWHPQDGTIQIDPAGINASTTWAQEPLEVVGSTPVVPRSDGDLLVLLQLDADTQVTKLSPYFRNMCEFVTHLCHHSRMPMRIRAHPLQPPTDEIRALVSSVGAKWDSSPHLARALDGAKAVACLNSSGGVEAIARGLPVLCYAKSIFRHAGAAYCLTNDPAETIAATTELAAGQSQLTREAQRAAVERIHGQQWPWNEIADRLPPMLSELLARNQGIDPAAGSFWSTYGRWLRDLPSMLFERAPKAA